MPTDVSQFIQMQRLNSLLARQPKKSEKTITHLFQPQVTTTGIADFLPNAKTKNTDPRTFARYPYYRGIVAKQKIPGGYVWGNSPFSQISIAVLYAGTPGSAGTSSTQFITPEDVYADSSGNLWVVEGGQNDIRTFTKSTGLITTFATLLGNSSGIVSYSGGFLVTDSTNSLIKTVTSLGVVSTFGSGLSLSTPTRLAIDATNLFITDRGNFVVKRVLLSLPTSATTIIGNGSFQTAGFGANNLLTPVTATSIGMGQIQGICIDSSGNIYITESSLNRILKYVPGTGTIVLFAGNNAADTGANSGFINGPGFTARFSTPMGITVDSNNNLYVADSVNLAVRKITPTGVVSTINTPALQGPNGVFCDKVNNTLYISDTVGSAIYKIQV
jgi:sugar lactone lactonase YvrE